MTCDANSAGCLELSVVNLDECTDLSDAAIAFFTNFDLTNRLQEVTYKGLIRTTQESLSQVLYVCAHINVCLYVCTCMNVWPYMCISFALPKSARPPPRLLPPQRRCALADADSLMSANKNANANANANANVFWLDLHIQPTYRAQTAHARDLTRHAWRRADGERVDVAHLPRACGKLPIPRRTDHIPRPALPQTSQARPRFAHPLLTRPLPLPLSLFPLALPSPSPPPPPPC